MTRAALLRLALLAAVLAAAVAPSPEQAFRLEARGADFRLTRSTPPIGRPNFGAVARQRHEKRRSDPDLSAR